MASIDISEVKGLLKVGLTSDRKGNEVVALEILGSPVAYASAEALERGEHGRLDAEDWQDLFAARLARFLGTVVLDEGDPVKWSTQSPTGREVYRLGPQEG